MGVVERRKDFSLLGRAPDETQARAQLTAVIPVVVVAQARRQL